MPAQGNALGCGGTKITKPQRGAVLAGFGESFLGPPRWGGGKNRNQQRIFRVNTKHLAVQDYPKFIAKTCS